jgi:hypothetical protein
VSAVQDGAAVFDLEAAAAAAEGETAPFPFTFKGESYELPAQTKWPVSALTALARGELDTALAVLLGEEQVERLMLAGITVGQLNVLFEGVAKSAGVENLPNFAKPARPGSRRT